MLRTSFKQKSISSKYITLFSDSAACKQQQLQQKQSRLTAQTEHPSLGTTKAFIWTITAAVTHMDCSILQDQLPLNVSYQYISVSTFLLYNFTQETSNFQRLTITALCFAGQGTFHCLTALSLCFSPHPNSRYSSRLQAVNHS